MESADDRYRFRIVKWDGPQPMLKISLAYRHPVGQSSTNWNMAHARLFHFLKKIYDHPRMRSMIRDSNDEGFRAEYIIERESDYTKEGQGSRMVDLLPFYDDGVSGT